ncbi:DUF5522 domain-containing protein [Zavarzinella formosa]|uniref:DUF5522 domain-containing protein n=1 Tax=Zavarzinella formosa TaxID=360055 RepID=UPI0002F8C88B|nr:DUF5522 domain-containing protein [Zavarzinella formosa]
MAMPGDGRPVPLPVEGRDYYIENGRWVFTAFYHARRGHCCGNGCRHCPYEPPHISGNEKLANPKDQC